MAVSVTVPAGTTDAPHSLFVVGSGASFAAASINIVIPPVLQSMQMRDTNGNGKVDQVIVVFDDTLGTYTAGVAPWTLTNVPSAGSLSSVTVAGSTATLTIAEGAGAANTAVGTFKIALAVNSAGIRDVRPHHIVRRHYTNRPCPTSCPCVDDEGCQRQRQGRPGGHVVQRGPGRVHRAGRGLDGQ
jgi:hypothetical protein